MVCGILPIVYGFAAKTVNEDDYIWLKLTVQH